MLIRSDTFRTRYFATGDMPAAKTVRSWVDLGILKGKIINTGGREQVWIDDAEFENNTRFQKPTAPAPAASSSASHKLAERILRASQR